ncbi:MAG: tetratricopeptide repeat protein [Candidatus Eiseniibacteriota bacterium]
MTRFKSLRRRAALALVALLLPASGSADPRIAESDAWARLEEMEEQGVPRDPFWAQAFWVQALAATDPDQHVADLRWALRFDPDLFAARWALCRAHLEARDPEFAQQALLAGEQALRSFLVQQRAALRAVTLSAGAVLVCFVTLALVTALRVLPRIHHGVWERLIFLPAELRRGAALLTVLVPLLLPLALPPTAALFWMLLLPTVAAWTFLEGPARRRCVGALVLILLAPLALAAWSRVAEPSHPGSYLRTLTTHQMLPDPSGSFRYAAPPAHAAADPAYHASLALVERRARRYDEAIAHLDRAIALAPDEWAWYNNLGNVLLLEGSVDDALTAYGKAKSLSPSEPLVRVNEAQAWMRKLRFNRADEALGEAVRLGYRLPPVLNTDPAKVVVRDQVLDAGQLWVRFAREQGEGHAITWGSAARMAAAPLVPLRPAWLSLVLLLALSFAAQSRSLPHIHSCAACGRAICRKCHYRIARQSLCAECNAIRSDVRAPIKREELLRARRRRLVRWPLLGGLFLSLAVPGTGLLLAGAPKRAALSLLIAAGILLTTGTGAFWPDAGTGLAVPPRGIVPWLPAALYGLLALVSARAFFRFADRVRAVGPRSGSD